ncbi:NitrOD5 domain-containing protein [Palaeococcus sp. (in: euryarchaeotes)]
MNKGEEILVKAISAALKEVAPGLEAVLEAHLRAKMNRGLEVAYENPQEFKDAASKLFGEYSARLLEMVIINKLESQLGEGVEVNSLEELVEHVKRIYGE